MIDIPALQSRSLRDSLEQVLKLGGSVSVRYTAADLHWLLDRATVSMQRESSLVDVQSPVTICGDIHGNYRTIFHVFILYGWPGDMGYLFLGDYVDRGQRSVEVVALLLMCHMHLPHQFHLLRGNHETKAVNGRHGFLNELTNRYGRHEGMLLWQHFNSTFDMMPVAALVNNKALCMHGGLSPRLTSLQEIRNIRRPLHNTEKEAPLAHDLMWADPLRANCGGPADMEQQGGGGGGKGSWWRRLGRRLCPQQQHHPGFDFNRERNTSVLFDEDEVAAVCQRLQLDMIVRAHEVQPFGYAFMAKHRLLSLFTAAHYGNHNNYGAVATVDAHGMLTVHVMIPHQSRNPNDPHHQPVLLPSPPSTHYLQPTAAD